MAPFMLKKSALLGGCILFGLLFVGCAGDGSTTEPPPGSAVCQGQAELSACDDQDPCTDNDRCQSGTCLGDTISREAFTCDGQDEDCDGVTDEDCSFGVSGHVIGGGKVTATNPDGEAIDHRLSTPRFSGQSSNESFVLTPGLPKGTP